MPDEKSIAHRHDMNSFGNQKYPDRLVPWYPAEPPELRDDAATVIGRLRHCGYCGSLHPEDVAAAIRAGARGSWADRKYGWPHKAYFDAIPNPHAGLPEVRCSSNYSRPELPREVREPRYDPRTGERLDDLIWHTESPRPAAATTHGKFYSVHLMDASPEDRALIERHLGIAFDFDGTGGVRWRPA